jgi:cell division protein FtsB
MLNAAARGGPSHSVRQNRRRAVRTLLPLGLLGLAVVGAPLMIFSQDGLPRLRAVERELAGVATENAEMEREIHVLRATVRGLRDDPATLERLARDGLGLIRHNEVIFHFPEP